MKRISLLLVVAVVAAAGMTLAGVLARLHLATAGPVYTQALVAAGMDADDLPRQVGLAIGYDLGAGMALIVALGWLARAVRQPQRWAQVTTWVVTAAAWPVLGCGLAAAPEGRADRPDEFARLAQDLVPSWYPEVHSVLVFGVLAASTAAAVLLLREPAQEFYRPGRPGGDPGWGGFLGEYGSDGGQGTRVG